MKNAELRVRARLNSLALQKNYRIISKLAPWSSVLPMVKADGYGHGAAWVIRTLAKEKKLAGFGVATLKEGREAREVLKAKKLPIIVFSGATPWNEGVGEICRRFELVPVISSAEDWSRFARSRFAKKISYQLKFNTGMNRMGIPVEMAGEVLRKIERSKLPLPQGVFSHLAEGERPASSLTRRQMRRFEVLVEAFQKFPKIALHLANSAGIWNHRTLNLSQITQVVRPGIALYGVRPWPQAPHQNLHPALKLEIPVVQLRTVRSGERIGYGGKARMHRAQTIALCAGGYGDGIPRGLFKKGEVFLHNRKRRFLGIISMDLCTVAATSQTRIGHWAEVLGPRIDPWKQAKRIQSIPYELLTSISPRVERIYE